RIKNRDVFYYLYRLRDIRIKHRFSTGSGYEGGDVSEGIIGYYQEVQPLLDEFVEWGNKNPEKMAQFIEKRYSE
ncbi:MAG: hypothetical protein NC821_00745, partial [Candidatus Omnitrophica bacterium]|nr:hypothetical protein [Candidatus Omnitrophota bacterium]